LTLAFSRPLDEEVLEHELLMSRLEGPLAMPAKHRPFLELGGCDHPHDTVSRSAMRAIEVQRLLANHGDHYASSRIIERASDLW
jgi:hypothetical protein